jgi:chromosome segregation ATPase
MTFASFSTNSIKLVAIVSAIVITAACASPQKVDRIHASIYHQQASIQQLQGDMQRVEEEREQVNAELQQLQADSSNREEQIQKTKDELVVLDARQADLNKVMKQVDNKVASNTRTISTINTQERKRQAIIKAQQKRWQQITAQTNTKLADIERQPLDSGLESSGSESTNVQH